MLHSANTNVPPTHKVLEFFDGVVSLLSTSLNLLPLELDTLI